ncbi:hypothetical protein JN11_04405 [Mucilaginibacter frigoritolerans]|jgi:hypothetical protein|uniref:Uncharacterized protein n=1 Tax=Mucilaginibacter frigoritolerans TaxID=652788 RepID=A0A562TR79_9SPHI|nr:hypothetical protein [Mucilaginibacter frigoritolerans]TWI95290.1 hypothetical protein JN11_04405 [Mucilaginibacter frigoritolerans]
MAKPRLINIARKSLNTFFYGNPCEQPEVNEKYAVNLSELKLGEGMPIFNDSYTNHTRSLQNSFFTENIF